MTLVQNAATTLVTAVVIPVGLFLTLLIVRAISYLWYVGLSQRPLPVVVGDFGAADEHGQGAGSGTVVPDALRDLPALLRDYVAADPPESHQLAPGMSDTVSAGIPAASPALPDTGWPAALVNLILPQKHAAYAIQLTPHTAPGGLLAASVQVVKTPENWVVAARTCAAGTLADLVGEAGGFFMEAVQLQRGFLRRTPLWEQWGSRGGYGLYRRAASCQESGDDAAALAFYEKASRIAPGNIRLGVRRATIYETRGRYRQAAELYDALHYMWSTNIEITYRAAAARVSIVQDLLEGQHIVLAGRAAASEAVLGAAGPRPHHAEQTAALQRSLQLLAEARRLFSTVTSDLRWRTILTRWTVTWLPMRRDAAQRRYWVSWLRRDSSIQPRGLRRRSKRHEYLTSARVALESGDLLRFLVDAEIRAGGGGQAHGADDLREPFDIDRSARSVLALIMGLRAGWLAHWSAATYFSRAALASTLACPRDWRRIEQRWRRHVSLGLPVTAREAASWRECCENIALGEIGRMLRHPVNQLSPDLLLTDPDMRRLRLASRGDLLGALIGAPDGSDSMLGM